MQPLQNRKDDLDDSLKLNGQWDSDVKYIFHYCLEKANQKEMTTNEYVEFQSLGKLTYFFQIVQSSTTFVS